MTVIKLTWQEFFPTNDILLVDIYIYISIFDTQFNNFISCFKLQSLLTKD